MSAPNQFDRVFGDIDRPPSHVRFHIQQVLESDSPRFPRRRFQHKSAKFGVENWYCIAVVLDHLKIRYASSLFTQGFIICQSLENVRLPQRQPHFPTLFFKSHDEIFYLITPSQSVSFLALCTLPYCQQLLNPPLPDMVCVLLGFGPIQRGPEGSNVRPVVSSEVPIVLTYEVVELTKAPFPRRRKLVVSVVARVVH